MAHQQAWLASRIRSHYIRDWLAPPRIAFRVVVISAHNVRKAHRQVIPVLVNCIEYKTFHHEAYRSEWLSLSLLG
jgi:hypothetical protein